MKRMIKKGITFACASLLSVAAFSQNMESEDYEEFEETSIETVETKTVTDVPSTVEASTASPKKTGKFSLNAGTLEVALHALDWSDPSLSIVTDIEGLTDRDVKWTSSDMNVVKVDQRGRLFPNKVGSATVTAETKDGQKSSCEVKITKFGPKPTSAGLGISTDLSGDAKIVFGVDLDTGRTGFATDQNIKLKMDVLNLGEVWAGESKLPVWGEIRILTEGDPLRYMVDSSSGTDLSMNSNSFAIVVDRAKVHVGNAFLTIYDRDNTDLGFANYSTGSDVAFSFWAADPEYRYGKLKQRSLKSYMCSYDDTKTVFGASAGYENDMFKIQGDIASTMKWIAGGSKQTDDTADLSHDATDYVYKFSGEFTGIENLKVKAGYSNGIIGEDTTDKADMRFGFQAEYKWNLSTVAKYPFDIYYVKPSAGVTCVQIDSEGDLYPIYTAGVLLGWEEKQNAFDYWGAKYSKDDFGPFPGISFAIQYADKTIASDCSYFAYGNKLTFNDDLFIIHASFNTGDNLLVKNLEAVGAVDAVNILSDNWVLGYTIGAVYNYSIPKTNLKAKPKFLVTRYHDALRTENDYAFFKAGVEIGYEKITLGFDYESNDVIHGYNNGEKLTKMGNIETSVKISF